MLENYTVYIISFVAFVAVLAMFEGGYLLWKSLNIERSVKVNKRLRALSATGLNTSEILSILRDRQLSRMPFLNRILVAVPRLHSLDRLLEQAGFSMPVSRFLGLQFSLVIVVFSGAYWIGDLILLFALPVSIFVGFSFPYFFVVKQKMKRSQMFTDQLPDTLNYIARSLRAGNPFSASLKSTSTEMQEPIAGEFGITFDELNYGLGMDDALKHLADRTGNHEIHYFITAVLIQKSTGGNLAEVLNRIADVMRARASTQREIRILSAEMKISANILIFLPVFVGILLSIIRPDYMASLFESEYGMMVIGAQLLLMGTGYWIIQKLINLHI